MDYSDELRRLVIATLKADTGVNSIVSDRVNDQVFVNPIWPFIRYGLPTLQKFEASCWDGSEHSVILHSFAKGPGTTNIARLNKAVVAALDGIEPALTGSLALASIDWVGTQVLNDTSELGAYHGIIEFTAQVVSVGP